MNTLLCLLLAFASPLALAADKTPAPKDDAFSLAKLQSTYKKASSVSADFTQEVYQASLAKTKTSKGSLKIAKPGLVRWEIYEPEASVMVSDGRKLSYFTPNARGPGKGQVIEKKAAELERQPIFRILSGAAPLDKEFTIEGQKAVEGEAGTTELSLKPKKDMADLDSAKMKVNSKYVIEELILEKKDGNRTKITLQNPELGAKLPAALFQFKVPAGTEVVNN